MGEQDPVKIGLRKARSIGAAPKQEIPNQKLIEDMVLGLGPGIIARLNPREVGEVLLKDISQRVPDDLRKALEFAQKRWPRLFGHINDIEITSNPQDWGSMSARPGDATSSVRFYSGLGETSALETVGHELTHVAQQLRRPNTFRDAYDLANRAKGGYDNNPFETSANVTGQNAIATGKPGLVSRTKLRRATRRDMKNTQQAIDKQNNDPRIRGYLKNRNLSETPLRELPDVISDIEHLIRTGTFRVKKGK